MGLLRGREGRWILVLAALAGLRVLLFALAFPFFTNIDEYRHVDVVLKYARGYKPVPHDDAYEPQTAELVGSLGSPEYHHDPALPADRVPPPVWSAAADVGARRVAKARAFLATRHSLEASQPPVYYATAGAWLSLGRALGFRGGALLYWVRGLSGLVGFALVLGSYLLLRDLYAGDALVRVGVPLLLACFPQDSMYYLTGDAFSPLLGGLGFLLVLRLLHRPESGVAAYSAAGLVCAAAVLTKLPNLAIAVACAFCSAVAWRTQPGARILRGEGGRWLLLWVALLAPLLFWLVRNQLLFGDPTASALKAERLGWGRTAFVDLWSHPIFTPRGVFEFLTGLVPTFWRGELAWYRIPLAWRSADLVYTVTTLILVPLAVLGLRHPRGRDVRLAEGAALVAVLAALAILVVLSLVFAFHESSNPPAHQPYFVQGRLISGVMVPFALLYVRGLEVATSALPARWRGRAAWGGLAALLSLVAVSELSLSRVVFASAYNWFHLP